MATYVSLVKFTDQGIRSIKESPARLDAARKAFEAAGGKLKEFYLAFGACDAIVLSEAPDDETAARVALMMGAQGNLRTETMRVFAEAEYRKIIGALR